MSETDPTKYFDTEIKRLNYFNSQFLKENDFRDEQLYHSQMRHFHNRSLHTWGIVTGLEVSQVEGAKRVTVSKGTAIDNLGREVVLPQDTSVPRENALPEEGDIVSFDDFEAGSTVFLTIKYREVFDQADKDTQSQSKLYTRTTERPLLDLSATAPAAGATEVVLATVTLDSNKNVSAVNPGPRRYAGCRFGTGAGGGEFSLYAGSDGAWHFFDGAKGADRLTIDGKGNVGLGAAPAGDIRLLVDTAGGTMFSLKCEHRGSNFIVRPQGAGSNESVIENTSGGALLINPNGGGVGIGRAKAGAALDVNGQVLARSLSFTKADGTQYPDNWIGMADNIDGTTKWLHVGGITDAGVRRLVLAANRVYMDGVLGIGTNRPATQLHIRKDSKAALGPVLTLMNGAGVAGAGTAIDFMNYDPSDQAASARIQSVDDGRYSGALLFLSKEIGANTNALQERMRINTDGNVGIGTPKPGRKLDVAGDLQLSGTRTKLFYRGDTDGHVGSLAFYSADGGKTAIITPYDGSGNNLDKSAVSLGGFGMFESNKVGLAVSGNAGVGIAPIDNIRLLVDTLGGTMFSLKCEHRGSNFIVRPQGAGSNESVIENTGGGALHINPRGNDVTVNGLSVPGAALPIRILGGTINGEGGIMSKGMGFSVTKVKNKNGLYDISFVTAFSAIPSAAVTQIFPSNTSVNDDGGNTKDNAVIVALTESRMRVKTGDGDGNAANRQFTFVVIGPR